LKPGPLQKVSTISSTISRTRLMQGLSYFFLDFSTGDLRIRYA